MRVWEWLPNKKELRIRGHRRRRLLGCETLEGRRVLNASAVQFNEGRVSAEGTPAADSVVVQLRDNVFLLTINDDTFRFERSEVNEVTVVGGGGEDTLTVVATEPVQANLHPFAAHIEAADLTFAATQTSSISVISSDPTSTAFLYGSTQDDQLIGRPGRTWMQGLGFTNIVRGFNQVDSQGGAGADQAFLYDSAEDDKFYAKSHVSWMEGSGFTNFARGFEHVYAYSSSGNDSAYLYDSASDDTFYAKPHASWIVSPTTMQFSRGFRNVFAYGSSGQDKAFLYDSGGMNDSTPSPM